MSERKKFLTIIVILGLLYAFFYYQDEITGFLKNPIQSLKKVDQQVTENINKEPTRVIYQDEEDATIKVVEKASPAVVSVIRKDVSFDTRTGPIEQSDSIGTGFIINGKEGIILTNKHVVEEENVSYSVVLNDGDKQYDVVDISRDPLNDFSILKIDLRGQNLPELAIGNSGKLKIGQTVVAIGNALGEFGNSVTKGIVSGLNRGILAQSGVFGQAEYLDNVIQTDAALNPGNSGGPLLNLQGEVVGINVATSRGAENIGFSIPIDVLKPAIEQFKTSGKITRPFLGIEYRAVTKEIAEIRGLPVGAFVETVIADSPAEKGGIRTGDIITRINSVRLDEEQNTLAKVIAQQKVGDTVTLTIDRGGKEIALKVKLEDSNR